jgi:hypothetical protein
MLQYLTVMGKTTTLGANAKKEGLKKNKKNK